MAVSVRTVRLVSLEQRPLPSGKPRIAAPSGQHEDYASALLALVNELTSGMRITDVPVVNV
jgi:hypothetical protein